jgi:hypothetical protein
MNKAVLRSVIADALDTGVVTIENWRRLRSEVLADGLTCREEVDLLIALDRSDVVLPDGWADGLTAAVLDYAVWTERRTGGIDAEAASWLIATLSAGAGLTDTARRIAFEVVKEADGVDESLIAFVLRAPRRLNTVKDAVDLAA